MLELRPSCEHCNRALPPESAEAWICSYECTFCGDCVERVLQNLCPNCGGACQVRGADQVHPARTPLTDEEAEVGHVLHIRGA